MVESTAEAFNAQLELAWPSRGVSPRSRDNGRVQRYGWYMEIKSKQSLRNKNASSSKQCFTNSPRFALHNLATEQQIVASIAPFNSP